MNLTLIETLPWWIAALGWSLLGAIHPLIIEKYKPSEYAVLFWVRVIIIIALTPFIPFLEFPDNNLFYLAIAGTVAIVFYTDQRKYATAAKYGAGILSRLGPITIWISFALWLAISPQDYAELINNPTKLSLIILAISGAVIASLQMKDCKISISALKYLSFALFLPAITSTLNKLAMDNSGFWDGILLYMWLQSILVFVLSIGVNSYHGKTHFNAIFTRNNIFPSLAVGAIMMFSFLCKNISMTTAENPAYVIAIANISSIWILIYYWIIKHKEPAHVKAGMLLVASAVLLILATRG